MNKKILCIYHGNCMDGFTAAWVVRRFYGEERVEFYPGVYQTPPPDCTGRDVVIVDFSYKLPVMQKIADECASLVVLDHHKTAAEDLSILLAREGVRGEFDMGRSGAMIAWDWYNPGMTPPKFISYVQDRDLWKFELPNTREIVAAIFSYEYDFNTWDELVMQCEGELGLSRLVTEGTAIERKHHKDIAELLKIVTFNTEIGGIKMLCANLPYIFSSDAAHKLAEQHNSKAGACYWDTPEGRVFSLRSLENGPDVSVLAKKYGGGGHKHAAGFKLDWHDIDLIDYNDLTFDIGIIPF